MMAPIFKDKPEKSTKVTDWRISRARDTWSLELIAGKAEGGGKLDQEAKTVNPAAGWFPGPPSRPCPLFASDLGFIEDYGCDDHHHDAK
jgi:hypothetical protein